ncbi:DNA polymerase III subunit delta [Thermodesulfovibrio sp. 3907-1M]|uniref:DNA polymerase III subunit delta n=1 Tax=Thermodesulfovibrio autotrophicus TaxID=3118333 RepID=A0AAU8GXU7_9BACT
MRDSLLEIQKFEQEIKKGLLKYLYFCYAQEQFFLFEAGRLIRRSFDPISIEIYDSPEEVDTNSFESVSLFTPKRILLVYNFEKLKKTEKKIEWLKKIKARSNTYVNLIILCNASYKDISEEINFIKKAADGSSDKERFSATVYNFDIHERQLHAWITYKASQFGISLKPDAVCYLIDITGGQPGLISSEIEKISLLTEKSHIGVFDIKDILTELGEFTAFDLVDAIKKKDRQRAFKLLDKLQNIEPDMILGALNWYYNNKTDTDEKVYYLLYRANLSLRQARSLSLDMLVYELMKE